MSPTDTIPPAMVVACPGQHTPIPSFPHCTFLLGKRLQSTAIRRVNVLSLNTSVSRARRVVVNLHFPGLCTLLWKSTC